jgi:hypothetical protein
MLRLYPGVGDAVFWRRTQLCMGRAGRRSGNGPSVGASAAPTDQEALIFLDDQQSLNVIHFSPRILRLPKKEERNSSSEI